MRADPPPKTIRTATGTITNNPAEEPATGALSRGRAKIAFPGSVAMPPVFLVVPVGLAVLLAALAHLGAVLIDA